MSVVKKVRNAGPKRALLVAAATALLVGTAAAPGVAQVKRVEMDIAGYLCGF